MSGAKATARGVERFSRWGYGYYRRALNADGADKSGLAAMTQMQSVSAGGDALVTLGLAGTLFFAAVGGQARDQVGLYLVVTLAPFAVLAPLIGPFLDRFRRARRLILMLTLLLRGALALQLATVINHQDNAFELYPLAFCLLVLSKAYSVTKSSVVPRITPPGISLVKANARLNIFSLVAVTAFGAVGGGVGLVTGDPAWTLRVAAVTFLCGAALTLMLPKTLDAPDLESEDVAGKDPDDVAAATRDDVEQRHRIRVRILPRAAFGDFAGGALWSAASVRWMNGFLVIFLAFLAKESGSVAGLTGNTKVAVIGAAGAAAGVGGMIGNLLGTRVANRRPSVIIVLAVGLVAGIAVLNVLLLNAVTLIALGLVVGSGQSLSKLGLDSILQREVPYAIRAAAFSKSEATLQFLWAIGGGIGVIQLNARIGFAIAALVAVAGLINALATTRRNRGRLHTGSGPDSDAGEDLRGRSRPDPTPPRPPEPTQPPQPPEPRPPTSGSEPTMPIPVDRPSQRSRFRNDTLPGDDPWR